MRTLKSFFILLAILFFFTACASAPGSTESVTETSSDISDDGSIKSDTTLEKDGYTMKKIPTTSGAYTIELEFAPTEYKNNYQPFQNSFPTGTQSFRVLKNPDSRSAAISYTKREGGTYIYSNNPEMLASQDIGQAILRTKDLSGDVMFTFEHSNHTGVPVWLGYQLLNEGDTDAVVTVTNVGLQVEGEWLGQRSWSDYFNYRFELPEDYFLSNGSVNPIYIGCDYVDYTPRVLSPVTVTIPAGEYIYVLGGTSADAFGNTNVGGTANKTVNKGKCANGAVKFNVSQGSVTGTFYCYTDASQVKANPKEQGYVVNRNNSNGVLTDYSKQYKGVDPTAGLIESNITFVVDERTKAGNLPVWYKKEYDPNYTQKNSPYALYTMEEKTLFADSWLTSLNPNNVSDAIGTDMMVFNCVDTEGNPIIIDNLHADASGEPANTGNWMVQYTDNMTFVNAGDTPRTIRIFKRGNGMLFTMVRQPDGTIVSAKALTYPYSFGSLDEVFAGVDKSLLIPKNGRYWFKYADGRPYCDVADEMSEVYEFVIQPMTATRLSVDYVILGNSNGGIRHWVEVE